MIHNLFKNEVYLEPNEHKYFDSEGNQYISFSKVYEFLVKKFDSNKVAGYCANDTKSKKEVIKEWDDLRDLGTRIDKALERYAQTASFDESDDDLYTLVPAVLKKYEIYAKCFEQGIPYCKKYRVAGSWDKLSLRSSRKDSTFTLSDFKCFVKGFDSLFTVSGQPTLNAPFKHLPNNKYTKISIQLSFYALLFEWLTGRRCERLFIDLIVPVCNEYGKVVSFTNQVVPVNYLKNDVKILLETFKTEILDMLNNTVPAEVIEDEEIF
jgi:hypothetical protein